MMRKYTGFVDIHGMWHRPFNPMSYGDPDKYCRTYTTYGICQEPLVLGKDASQYFRFSSANSDVNALWVAQKIDGLERMVKEQQEEIAALKAVIAYLERRK